MQGQVRDSRSADPALAGSHSGRVLVAVAVAVVGADFQVVVFPAAAAGFRAEAVVAEPAAVPVLPAVAVEADSSI